MARLRRANHPSFLHGEWWRGVPSAPFRGTTRIVVSLSFFTRGWIDVIEVSATLTAKEETVAEKQVTPDNIRKSFSSNTRTSVSIASRNHHLFFNPSHSNSSTRTSVSSISENHYFIFPFCCCIPGMKKNRTGSGSGALDVHFEGIETETQKIKANAIDIDQCVTSHT